MRMFAVVVGLLASVAFANPVAAKEYASSQVSITGPGLDAPLVVKEPSQIDQFDLLVQVYTDSPAGSPPDRPGPAYVLVFTRRDGATHAVTLYPYASTGPFMQLGTGWYRTFGSAIRPMREAGVPLGTPPWETQTEQARAVPPIKRSTSDVRLIAISGLAVLVVVTLLLVGRRFARRAA